MRNLASLILVIAFVTCAAWIQAQNTGIGVMSPLEKLHISEGSLLLSGVPGSRAGIELITIGAPGNSGGRIFFREENNDNFGFSIGFSGANYPGALLNWEPNTFHISSHSNDSIGQIALTIKRDTRFIGIGTVAPVANLDIVGTFKISDGTQDAGKVLTSDTSGFATWEYFTDLETDPQVGPLSVSSVPKWDGSALVDGLITDNGSNISIENDALINGVTVGKGPGVVNETNTALGVNALESNSTGLHNTAVGLDALRSSVSGWANTAIGLAALGTYAAESGYNTAVGYVAMASTDSGIHNTALGAYTMLDAGNYNVAVGSNAMQQGHGGEENVAIGAYSLRTGNAGSRNTAVGMNSGRLANGDANVFLGYEAGYNETGSDKLYIGNSDTPTPLIWGDFAANVLKVYGALNINDAYAFPTSDGASGQVLSTDGAGSISWQDGTSVVACSTVNVIPKWDGSALVDGLMTDDGNNISIPTDAFINEITIGRGSGNLASNMAIGKGAFDANQTGVENTALGYDALRDNEDGGQNTAVGLAALTLNVSASNNTGVGYAALNSTTGGGNTAIGSGAMVDLVSGTNNVAVGAGVMPMLNAGERNTSVGQSSGHFTVGDGNVFLGYKAGFNETGSDKLYIDNSDTPDPLIYGDFDQDNVTIHGSLRVTDLANDNAQDSVLVVDGNGTLGYRDAATLGGGGSLWTTNGNDIENTNTGNVVVNGQLSVENSGASDMHVYGANNGHVSFGLLPNGSDARAWNFLNGRLIFGTNNQTRMTILGNGDVGIGTSSPAGKLSLVNHGISTVSILFRTDDGYENNQEYSTARIQAGYEDGEGDWNQGFLKFDNTTAEGVYSTTMTLKGGNVGIGTTTPQSKLAVNGKITCKEVEVTLVGFPDYVFEDDYELMPLKEVEAFIDVHGHLPNVPSAQEVEENGLGLGAMNKILLEKVEELTLHLIQKDADITALKSELRDKEEAIASQIAHLESRIAGLER